MMPRETEAFAFTAFTQDSCSSVDSRVGGRIRRLRSLAGIGIDELAELIGVTALKMRRYEFGEIRVTAEDLLRICGALNAPPSFFFESDPVRADG